MKNAIHFNFPIHDNHFTMVAYFLLKVIFNFVKKIIFTAIKIYIVCTSLTIIIPLFLK